MLLLTPTPCPPLHSHQATLSMIKSDAGALSGTSEPASRAKWKQLRAAKLLFQSMFSFKINRYKGSTPKGKASPLPAPGMVRHSHSSPVTLAHRDRKSIWGTLACKGSSALCPGTSAVRQTGTSYGRGFLQQGRVGRSNLDTRRGLLKHAHTHTTLPSLTHFPTYFEPEEASSTEAENCSYAYEFCNYSNKLLAEEGRVPALGTTDSGPRNSCRT